jgi:hypothetical protein
MSGYAVGHVLRSSRASGTSLLVLIVIAEATHQDGTGAWPAIASIARLARTTERSVYRVIRDLELAGELIVERGSGPHGTNLYAIPGIGQLRLGDDARVTPDKTSPLTTGASGDDTRVTRPLTTGAPGDDTAVSPEPSSYPVLDPSKNLSRARPRAVEFEKTLSPKQVERDQHRFGKEAERVWHEAARGSGNPYTDRPALRAVHDQAIEAARFADEQLVLAAIRERMDEKSSPRRIPEWARLAESDRRQAVRLARKAAERADRDVIVEHEGTRYLGHVPDAEGGVCRICKGSLDDHKLAAPSAMRHLGPAVRRVVSDVRARSVSA